MPHAWAEDSDHAREVREARGEIRRQPSKAFKIAAYATLAYVALKLVGGRFRHA